MPSTGNDAAVRIATVVYDRESAATPDDELNAALGRHEAEGYRLHSLSHEVTAWEDYTSRDDPTPRRSATEITYTLVLHRVRG